MPAQPYHHGDLRRTLLEAAARSLETDGIDALSLRQLARDAGVSHAAPSRHFRDKQALLDALAEDGFVRMSAALERASGAESATSPAAVRARFDALARAYVAFALAQPTLLALMFGLKHSPDARAELIAAGHASMEVTMRVVLDAQATGAIGPGDAQRIALVAFATFHGIATLASGGLLDGVPADDLVAAALDLFWRGLQP
ncbi:transcriptional regulator [Leifsonia sp. Root4]|uniref:TetR/AcrR family transcriptional regulator n=1 Tax=Leifsonia sp. Root4 TaxID=1736525 RepID=UPI0006FA1F0D|nr:TetR/AcrR family transcriptional regulator [Leifsonia sp. Root4]KQW06243.1 transcriptional regulator [Leifsonia sp. Root4]